MADSSESETEEQTIADDLVVTKYKMAGEIVNRVLRHVVSKAVHGASARDLCQMGDNMIDEETSNVFKKELDVKKGIAFPTCVAVNYCVAHFSPLYSDPDYTLKKGDMVKMEMGAHVDGFIAVVGHTFVIGASKNNVVTGRQADVILSAYQCSEAALRSIKPGLEDSPVTDTVQKVAESYNCKPVEGMLSHQLLRNNISGKKQIIQNPNEQQRKDHEKCQFEVHEVYAIDCIVTSGEGKVRELDQRTTIYRKTDVQYSLKMKASRAFFSEMNKRFTTMPFTLRAFEDEKKARMGVFECVKHQLVEPFTVLWDKEGEFVAQFKFTVLLMPNGPLKITGYDFDPTCYKSDFKITDKSVNALLATSISRKAMKKKKKKASQKAAEASQEDDDD